MKRMTCLVTAIIILFANSQMALAITYYDECNSLETTEEVAIYKGFVAGEKLNKIVSAVDPTYFNLKNVNEIGMVTYKVRGVEKLRVKVYTKSSLYAVHNNGDYVLGYKTFLNPPPISAKYLVYTNPDKELFVEIMGEWHRFDMGANKFISLGEGATKPTNLINFGVQGFYSSSANATDMIPIKSYRKTNNEIIVQVGVAQITPYFYETYEFDVPKTAEKIGIAVYDGGIKFERPILVNDIRLAKVEFEGNKIELGEKVEILPPPSSLPSTGGVTIIVIKPSSPSKSSSSKVSSSKSSSSKSSSIKSSSSKLSSSKASSLKSSTSRVSEGEKEVLGDDEIGKEESMVYLKVEGAEVTKPKTDMKSIAVTAVYSTIVLTGVVTFVLKVR